LAGLKVAKLSDWIQRQEAYLAAVKKFLTKLKPQFATLPVLFVKAIHYDPKLLLSIKCLKAKQYVTFFPYCVPVAFFMTIFDPLPKCQPMSCHTPLILIYPS